MKISDERREVAARLSSCIQGITGTGELSMYLYDWVRADGETEYDGNPYTVAANRWKAQRTLELLADLIDPTCHVDVNKHGRAYCTNCGCDDWCLADGSPFCPNCGARVVSSDD